MQNEPNSRRTRYPMIPSFQSDAYRAKRTQFPPGETPTIPLFHHSNPMPIVQNEANFALGVRKWARAGGLGPLPGPIMQNEANSPGGAAWDRA